MTRKQNQFDYQTLRHLPEIRLCMELLRGRLVAAQVPAGGVDCLPES